MSACLRVAIVGAGYWGTQLIRTFHSLEGCELHTICDTSAALLQEVQQRHRAVTCTSSLDAVLQDPAIDAVAVATPPASHFALASAALAANKHVWVEKPLALRHAEGRQLVAVARERGRALFVDETFLYDPLVEQARRWLVAGVIGAPFHVSLERTGMGRVRRDSNVWWNSAPHDLSLLRYVLASRVEKIAVSGHAFLQPGIEDVVWASVRLENGVSAHIYLHWLFPEKKAPLMIVGERGMIAYEGRFEKRALTRYAYRLGSVADRESARANVIPIEQQEKVEKIAGDRSEPLVRACAAFRDMIVHGAPAPSSGAESLHTLAALDAGAQSLARGGVWLDVPDPAKEG